MRWFAPPAPELVFWGSETCGLEEVGVGIYSQWKEVIESILWNLGEWRVLMIQEMFLEEALLMLLSTPAGLTLSSLVLMSLVRSEFLPLVLTTD